VSGFSFLSSNEAIPEENILPSQVREQRAKWGFFFLCSFTVAVFARPEDIFPFLGPLHLTFTFGLCAGLAYLGTLLLGDAGILWSAELQIVLLLTGWYIAGVPFAIWRGGSFLILTHVWLKTLTIFFLLTQTLVTLERIRKVLWAIIFSELVVTSLSIVQPSDAMWNGERLRGMNLGILGWNFLGIAAAVTIPYIAALFITERSTLKMGLLATTFLSTTWMLVLTASRSGILDVLFSTGLTSLLVLRGSSRGKLIGVALTLALLVAVSMAPEVFWQRLETLRTSSDISMSPVMASAQESEQDRLSLLTRSIQYTLEHPIFGLGLGNFGVTSGTQLGRPSAWESTHNTFTQISSEAGIPALLLFMGLLIAVLRAIKRVSNRFTQSSGDVELNLMARATVASLLSFAFGAFFANLAYEYYFFYPVAIAVGIQHIARTTSVTSDASTGEPAALPRSSLPNQGL
jgi:O-antigen ligase